MKIFALVGANQDWSMILTNIYEHIEEINMVNVQPW
jgi:hypothetical protein